MNGWISCTPQERTAWYQQQPDRRCVACGIVKSATEFGFTYRQEDGYPRLHQRCKPCHQQMREQGSPQCTLCARKLPEGKFLGRFQNYRLFGGGARFYVCCRNCKPAFLALPEVEQRQIIRSACDITFPPGQVIYTLSDPNDGRVRYIGRTHTPARRLRAHQHNRSLSPDKELGPFNVKRRWTQALYDAGREPMMTVVHPVSIGPLAPEWEYRYIAHGIQHGWDLLNLETHDERFVAMTRSGQVDFLQAPFAYLIKIHLFEPYGLEAFVRAWYDAADNEPLEAEREAAE